MNDTVRLYVGKDIDVTYDAERCIHAAECTRGLPAVFNNSRRPWIDPNGASAEAIAAVIVKCPSGALHFIRHDGGSPETPSDRETVTVMPGGPLYVRGPVELRTADGRVIVDDTRLALCRCGQSHNKPFCDNSHLDVAFDDLGVAPETEANQCERQIVTDSGKCRRLWIDGSPAFYSEGECTCLRFLDRGRAVPWH